MTGQIVRFRGYALDSVTRQLFAPEGAVVPLSTRPFDVLAYLVANRERVVGRDELLENVWRGRVVEENNLAQAIAILRRAFGTDAADHAFILTVPGQGYRFVAPMDVDASEASAAETGTPVSSPNATQGRGRLGWFAAAVVVLVVAATFYASSQRPQSQAVASQGEPSTLAVLPFRSLDAGQPDALLELGLADTLIARLGQSDNLRVMPLGSVQALVGRDFDPLATGARLGADYVVAGSTQVRGRLVRVEARLLSVRDGRTLWSGASDAPGDRVFTLQESMLQGLSGALALRYPKAARHRSACDGEDGAAYRAYLRGKHLMFRPQAVRLSQAIAAFEEAIARDRYCARAWAGMAFAYRSLAMTADADPRDVFPKARAAIDRALRIDPGSAEGHASKGMIEFWYDWDWAAAESSLRHAITLDDNLAEAHYALAHLLHNLGRNDEGLPHALRAAELDPVSPIINTIVASFLIGAGRADEAAVRLDGVLQMDPDFWTALFWRSKLRAGHGDWPGAIADMARANEACRRCSHAIAGLAWLQARHGDLGQAEQLLLEMRQRDAQAYFPATRLMLAYEGLGRRDEALASLERGYEERDLYMTFLLVDQRLQDMRSEPRFNDVLKRMELGALPSERQSARLQ